MTNKKKRNRYLAASLRPATGAAFSDQNPPAAWPSVSLCMIVKNEEEHLPGCLASVADFPSETIVVDTGSNDRTAEIARSCGAQVKHFAWANDFAAARNESIREATGEWIFWMDADDRIAPNELIRLKHAVASGQAEAYVCRVMSQSGQKGVIEAVEHIRLFRNGLGLCFERPLHEDIAPAARRLGVTIARAGVTIQHVGYAAGPQALQAKARRNREMIEQCLAREPGSLYWRFQLGVNLYTLEDFAGAAEHLAAVVAAPPASLVENREIYKAHALLVAAYVALPRPDEAQQALRHALKLFPGSRHVHILAGKFYLAQDEPERAVEALERARGLSSEADVTGMEWPGGALEAYLSQAYLQLAKRWSSQRDFVRMAGTCALAVEVSPQNGEAYKHLAVALQAIGRQEDALLCWQTARRLEDVSRS